MKFFSLIFLAVVWVSHGFGQHVNHANNKVKEDIPILLKDHFMDDYGIQFTINDSLWTQHPNVKYHIISWDTAAQFLLAQKGENNPGDRGLYTLLSGKLIYIKKLKEARIPPFRYF